MDDSLVKFLAKYNNSLLYSAAVFYAIILFIGVLLIV